MSATKIVTLERLSQFKTLQDSLNESKFLGIEATAVDAGKLHTAVTIDGVSFDGSANITTPYHNVQIYSAESSGVFTFYSDSAKTTELTVGDRNHSYIDVTTRKAVFWDGSQFRFVEAADTTPRIASSEKGVANGVATLDSSGLIPSTQLPSYVDDVIQVIVENPGEANEAFYLAQDGTKGAQLTTGEHDKIYVDINATIDGTYRWAGAAAGFVKVGSNVSTADAAVKATNDANGDQIDTTYVKVQANAGLMTNTQASQLAALVAQEWENATSAEIEALFATGGSGGSEEPSGGEGGGGGE